MCIDLKRSVILDVVIAYRTNEVKNKKGDRNINIHHGYQTFPPTGLLVMLSVTEGKKAIIASFWLMDKAEQKEDFLFQLLTEDNDQAFKQSLLIFADSTNNGPEAA